MNFNRSALYSNFLHFKEFTANVNSNDPVTNYFDEPIQTIGIRIKPQRANDQSLALRVELKGCRHECEYPAKTVNDIQNYSSLAYNNHGQHNQAFIMQHFFQTSLCPTDVVFDMHIYSPKYHYYLYYYNNTQCDYT